MPVRGAPVTNHGAADLFVDDAGVAPHVLGELQAHLEEPQQEAPRHPAADDGELGFVLERGQQHVERFEEVVAAEVGHPAVGDAQRRPRLREQRVARERQLGDLGDRQDAARVHRLHPVRTRRRLPGHWRVTGPRRVRPSPRAGRGT